LLAPVEGATFVTPSVPRWCELLVRASKVLFQRVEIDQAEVVTQLALCEV